MSRKPHPWWAHVLRWPLYLLLPVLLMGQDCNQQPQPDPDVLFCRGSETTLGSLEDGVVSTYATIVGGQSSTDRRSTFYLRHGGGCTATAIGPRTAITAAHCITADPGNFWLATDLYDISTRVKVTDYRIHPEYVRWPNHDVALLYTETDLPEPYQPPSQWYDVDEKMSCEYALSHGWGMDERTNPDTTEDKWPEGHEPVDCGKWSCLKEARFKVTGVTTGLLPGKQTTWGGICFGDSGGPLYVYVNGFPRLAGVTTTTNSRDCLNGSTYVRVAPYREWAQENVRP